ncbi:MAG: CarD family transcriptional regulator [Myxococcales bacterium]|nr:CarD family transcriptional regulator [Myxococcales bacterium]
MAHFTVGDIAVYQGQGIGRITDISTMEVAGASLEFYTVHMDSGTIVRVPTHKADDVGLRSPIDPQDVPAVYGILKADADRPADKTWNRRYRAYSEKLRSGSVEDLAQVTRDLYRLQDGKDLSFGERQMLEQARTLLVKELSLATRRDEGEIAQEIEAVFNIGL